MLKTCRDQWSKPAPSSRPLQDSLTALTRELRAVLQQQPRNVRISSTLLPGMSWLPSPPFLQRGLILSPPLFWTCHIPSTQFSEMSVTALALFLEELGVSGTQFSELSDSPTEKTSSIKPFPYASSTAAKPFHASFKTIEDPFLDRASKESVGWLLSQVTQHFI